MPLMPGKHDESNCKDLGHYVDSMMHPNCTLMALIIGKAPTMTVIDLFVIVLKQQLHLGENNRFN